MAKVNWDDRGMLCGRCKFYVPKRAGIVGRCRRRCPEVERGWPVVYPDDFCGEFKLDDLKLKATRKSNKPSKRSK